MDNTILQDLLYYNKVPKVIRDMDNGLEAIRQVISRAADEIERLQKENESLQTENKKLLCNVKVSNAMLLQRPVVVNNIYHEKEQSNIFSSQWTPSHYM